MSCYNWEKGSFAIPAAEWSKLKSAVRDAVNEQNKLKLEAAIQLHAYMSVHGKGKRHFELNEIAWKGIESIDRGGFRSGPKFCDGDRYDIVQSVIDEKYVGNKTVTKLRKPLKKDFPQHGNTTTSFTMGEANVSFDNDKRTATWVVHENNRAVEAARATVLADAFFKALGNVKWTRGTGGSVYGNDEYNRDAGRDYEGGGGSYSVESYGPDVPKPKPSANSYGGYGGYRW